MTHLAINGSKCHNYSYTRAHKCNGAAEEVNSYIFTIICINKNNSRDAKKKKRMKEFIYTTQHMHTLASIRSVHLVAVRKKVMCRAMLNNLHFPSHFKLALITRGCMHLYSYLDFSLHITFKLFPLCVIEMGDFKTRGNAHQNEPSSSQI